jgi:hypothetical protein
MGTEPPNAHAPSWHGDDPAGAADSPYGPKHHRPFGRYYSERTGCTNL